MKKDKYSVTPALWTGIGFALFFIIWAILVSVHSLIITNFDNAIIKAVCNTNPINISFARHFTIIGNTKTITILTIIIFFILYFMKKRPYAYFLAAVMILANGLNWLLKHLIRRSRPSVHHLIYADGYSFPSGHSVGSAALFGCLIVITLFLIRNKLPKIIFIIILFLFPLLIGYTRIFLHVHYPSDVLGGWLEGIVFVLLGDAGLAHYLNLSNYSQQ